MINQSLTVTFLLVLSIAGGCTSLPSYRPELPEDIGDKGLVVAQVTGIDQLRWWSSNKEVLIDDRKQGVIINGFIALPLTAGDHELSGLFQSNGESIPAGAGSLTSIHTTRMPLQRKFTIRPRQITNLGLIVLYPDPNDKERKGFLCLFVDNTGDMKHFLKATYPVLAAKLNADSMTLAPGNMMPANLFPALRKELAVKETVAKEEITPGRTVTYIATDIGTLAEISKSSDGKIIGVKLIDVPTVSNIQSVSPNYVKDRFAFLTTSNRLFVVTGGAVAERDLPRGLLAPQVYVLGTNDLVIIDDKFQIYTSYDDGHRWQPYLGSMTENPVRAKLAPAANGYYVYTTHPVRVFFGPYGRVDFRQVDIPQDLKDLDILHDTATGLFVELRYASFGFIESKPRQFFIRPTGKANWESRSMPATNCMRIKYLEDDGLRLSTECGKYSVWGDEARQRYASSDGGKTWRK